MDSKTAVIEGGVPLVGSVKISGSRSLALKLIYASIISGENCTLVNIPKAKYVLDDLDVIKELGIDCTWLGEDRLIVSPQGLKRFEIDYEKGSRTATVVLLVPALVHKFGKAVLPKSVNNVLKRDRGREYARIWSALGMQIKEDFDNYYIEAVKLSCGEIVLPYKSRVLTDLAILSTLFVLGESTILNASTDTEIDDLISFVGKIGGDVVRLEEGPIRVRGNGVFKGVDYECGFDREEAAFFILSTLLTNGNVTLTGIERTRLLPFINWLAKTSSTYEFSSDTMWVWHNIGTPFERTEVSVSPHPGFITDFQPLAILFDCFATGESVIKENLQATNLGYISDLNRMGADIDVTKEDEEILVKITGPAHLKSGRIVVSDLRNALVSLLFALVVEGRNELSGFDIISDGFSNIAERLRSLGASIAQGGSAQ